MATKVDSCLRLAERVGLQAAAKASNFVFSPVSMRAALAFAAAGARGETLDQMLSFLGASTVDKLNRSAARLMTSVRASRDGHGRQGLAAGPALSFVSGAWVDRSTTLRTTFRDVAASFYGVVANSVDFQHQAAAVVKEVNEWASMETNGLINDLLPTDAVQQDTRFILANALHFKGTWADRFDASLTRTSTFHLLDKTRVQVPFMKSYEEQMVSSFDGFKALKLYYQHIHGHGKFYMLILLPDEKDGVTELMQRMSSDATFIQRHTPNHRIKLGNFKIPKFRISHGFEASEVLKDLGLRTPFDDRKADFTEMASPTGGLFIDSVHHKAKVEVYEEGTITAAATAIIYRGSWAPWNPSMDFVADHPFLFAIVEEGSGSLFFLGLVVNPLLAN